MAAPHRGQPASRWRTTWRLSARVVAALANLSRTSSAGCSPAGERPEARRGAASWGFTEGESKWLPGEWTYREARISARAQVQAPPALTTTRDEKTALRNRGRRGVRSSLARKNESESTEGGRGARARSGRNGREATRGSRRY